MLQLLYRIGYALKESGQALERVGCRLQGVYAFEEAVSVSRPRIAHNCRAPQLGHGTFVAPTATLAGEVIVGDKASIWYNCTVRGEVHPVSIGEGTNLQDGVVVGSLSHTSGPTVVGRHVSVGHGATLRGCQIGDLSLIGIGAVLERCKVGSGAIVAANAVVLDGTEVPSGELWGGNPATKLRDLKEAEKTYLQKLPGNYVDLARDHQEVLDMIQKRMDQLGDVEHKE